jgi:hypothetical protein
MSLTTAVLAVLPALIFFTLGTAKVVALQPMRARAAEVGFSTPPSFLAPEDLAALMTGAHQGQ